MKLFDNLPNGLQALVVICRMIENVRYSRNAAEEDSDEQY